jgi:voltage-gated potassium channel Kch
MNKTSVNKLSYRNIIIQHVLIILLGILIFYVDKIEFLDPFFPKLFLVIIAFLKVLYFLGHSFKKIEDSTAWNITYNKFILVILINISLLVLSFAVDYTCLFLIDANSFKGIMMHNPMHIFFDFNYFSILTFSTVGYGDISPITSAAKLLVIMEVIISFVTIIIIISNFAHMKESSKEFSLWRMKDRSAEGAMLDRNPRKPVDDLGIHR